MQGLVFTAGNAVSLRFIVFPLLIIPETDHPPARAQDTFSRVLVTLKVLRNRLYTTLPAEIFSYPGEEPSDEVRSELERYGAVLRTVEEAQRDTKRTWVLRFPFLSSFRSGQGGSSLTELPNLKRFIARIIRSRSVRRVSSRGPTAHNKLWIMFRPDKPVPD